ncbi:MAG: protein kinase [Myxococcota bacterium]
MGTPAYMAPEQARGEVVGTSADIYALGAMLYHLLAGRSPYSDVSGDEILSRLGRERPTPVAELAPEAPRELVAVVMRAMASEPAERYSTARELADDLKRFQTGQLVSAHSYSWYGLLARWLRRHRLTVTVAAALLAVLVAGGVISVQRIIDERDTAREQRALAQSERTLAEVASARAAARAHELTLAQAQTELTDDPSRSLAWLMTLPERAEVWPTARFIATEARRRGVARFILDGHRDGVTAIGLANDGRSLLSGARDGGLLLWDLQSGAGRALAGHVGKSRGQHLGLDDPYVLGAVFSPDGERMASAGLDGTVRLWTRTGEEIERIELTAAFAEFAPDGHTLVMAGPSDTITLRSLSDGQTRELGGNRGGVSALALSAQTDLLAAAGGDGAIRLWDIASGTLVHTLRGHGNAISKVTFSPDGTQLASAGYDRTMRIWSVASGRERAALAHDGPVYDVAFTPDGSLLASGDDSGAIRLWNPAAPERAPEVLRGHQDAVFDVAFSDDSRMLASAGMDAAVRVWHRGGTPIRVFRGHSAFVLHVAFVAGSRRLVSASEDSTIRVWNLPERVDELRGSAQVTTLAFAPDSRTLGAAFSDGSGVLWQVADSARTELPRHDERTTDIAFSHDGRYVATASWDRTVRLYDRRAGTSRELDGHSDKIRFARFSPDDRYLVSVSHDHTLRVWSVADPAVAPRVLRGHDDTVIHLAFVPDGEAVVSASYDGTARLWPLTGNGDPRGRVITQHRDKAYHVAVSPDGQRVASASADRTVIVHDRVTGAQWVMDEHEQSVNIVEFSPDGRYLASMGKDRYAVVWELASDGRHRLRGHTLRLKFLAFSPDSRRLATTGEDTTLRLWDTATGQGHTLARLDDLSTALSFSPDGTTLAVGTLAGQIHLWRDDLPTAPAQLKQWITATTSARVPVGE